MRPLRFTLSLALVLAAVAACAAPAAAPPADPATSSPTVIPPTVTSLPQTLRLATTTSTQDTGLLDAILPVFEQRYNATVEVVAVGTGQALAIGAKGDADVVLVHARKQEDAFVAAGDGIGRLDVMYNDFIIVGPPADPAGIASLTSAKDAFAKIASAEAPFVSRGDKSGTNSKELGIWASANITPTTDLRWYLSIGQGMGETLQFTNEKLGYTLTDRGTWLAQQANLPALTILVGGANLAENPDKSLLNRYGVIQVNPAAHPGVNADLAAQFAEWLTSEPTQKLISEFGVEEFSQPLFIPDSAAWHAAHP